MKTRIVVVDDHPLLLDVLREKLSFFDDLNLKFVALSGRDLLDKLELDSSIDLILMDIEMPDMDGISATFEVKKRYPHIKVLMLTVYDSDTHIFNSIKAGADGYLLKEVSPDILHRSIKDTLDGGAAMTPSIALKTLRLLRDPIRFEVGPSEFEQVSLSSRELDVLEQLSKGLSYTVIASNLFISPYTVRKHTENIYKKLQVHNKLEAVQKARDNKLI